MQELIFIRYKVLCNFLPKILRGIDYKGIAVLCYPGHSLKSLNKSQKSAVAGLGLNLQSVVPFRLDLVSELIDTSAGDQVSVHENTDPVTDLLDLVELMAGYQDRLLILNAQLLYKA